MKADRYNELLSKVDTDPKTDERIKKTLREYQYNDNDVRANRRYGKTNKTREIYSNRNRSQLSIKPKVSLLRQALPSFAFLVIIMISIYGLVFGFHKDSKNTPSELTASSELTSGTANGSNGSDTNTANNESHIIVPDSETTDPEASEAEADNSEITDNIISDTEEQGTADSTDALEEDTSEAAISFDSEAEPEDETTDPPNDTHYIITENSAEFVRSGNFFYKNETYREDLKLYLIYNAASKVNSLFLQSIGSVDKKNYSVDGNIITLRKEYLDTLPDGLYTLQVKMDVGNPAIAQFSVHPKEEESEFGFYRFSSYYWDYYLSDPKDFTFLVFNCKGTRITGLRNGSNEIDPGYYQLEENGYVATLDQSYMADMEEGVRFDLTVIFSDGMEKTIGIKIRYKKVNTPYLNPTFYVFEKSKPEDVKLTVLWNDAQYITSIDPETHFSVGLSSDDYTLKNDTFTIKKEFLSSLDAGEYIWYLNFDTETGADIRIKVND